MLRIRNVNLPDRLALPTLLSNQSLVGFSENYLSQQLMAVDIEGESLWSLKLQNQCRLGDIGDGCAWLFESQAIVGVSADGVLIRRELLDLEEQERIGCLSLVEGGIIVSVYRIEPHDRYGLAPRVMRFDSDFEQIWSIRLPINKVAYQGCGYMGVDTNWEIRETPPWNPSTWLPCGEDQLLVSGNRILASFQEMPRTGIGCRYVLDAGTGELVWKSKSAPIANACALGDGRFLMGNQGYGAFQSALYEDGVLEMQSWPSHGHTVVVAGDYISVQMSNDLSVPQHVVRLEANGDVSRMSQRLPGYYTSKPVLLRDGNLYFWRGGEVWAWSCGDGLRSIYRIDLDDGAHASSMRLSDNRVAFNIRPSYTKKERHRRVFAILEC